MASPDKGVGGVYRGGSGATLDAELTTRYLSVLPLILKRLQIMLCHINQNWNHIPKVYFSDVEFFHWQSLSILFKWLSFVVLDRFTMSICKMSQNNWKWIFESRSPRWFAHTIVWLRFGQCHTSWNSMLTDIHMPANNCTAQGGFYNHRVWMCFSNRHNPITE